MVFMRVSPPPLKNNCIEHFAKGGDMPDDTTRSCSIDSYDCKTHNQCDACDSRRCNLTTGKCYKRGTQGQDCRYDIHCADTYGCNKYHRCTRGNA